MDQHYHPRRRRAGRISVIRAEGVSKVFVFREEGARSARAPPVPNHRGLGSRVIAARQECTLASGQKRHQTSVVLVILGEQSRVISRECRSRRTETIKLALLSALTSHFPRGK